VIAWTDYGTRSKDHGVGERANWLSEGLPLAAFLPTGILQLRVDDEDWGSVVRCLFRPGPGTPLKAFLIILLLCVSGCSWFHRKPHAPDPAELIVIGAPVGSQVFVDGVQAGQPKAVAKQPQEVEVTPGTHILEVRVGDTVAYRENTYVTPGEKHVISVLSGTGRN
jgi:hypothetical protein